MDSSENISDEGVELLHFCPGDLSALWCLVKFSSMLGRREVEEERLSSKVQNELANSVYVCEPLEDHSWHQSIPSVMCVVVSSSS